MDAGSPHLSCTNALPPGYPRVAGTYYITQSATDSGGNDVVMESWTVHVLARNFSTTPAWAAARQHWILGTGALFRTCFVNESCALDAPRMPKQVMFSGVASVAAITFGIEIGDVGGCDPDDPRWDILVANRTRDNIGFFVNPRTGAVSFPKCISCVGMQPPG